MEKSQNGSGLDQKAPDSLEEIFYCRIKTIFSAESSSTEHGANLLPVIGALTFLFIPIII